MFLKRLFTSKRPFQLTRPGWVFILYTIGVGAGAINTGNNLLYLVFGVFLGIIMASGFLSDMSLWRVRVNWNLPEFGEAESMVFLPLTVHNSKKWFPSLSLLIELEGKLGGQTLRLKTHVPYLSPRETRTFHVMFRPPRRGWFQMTGVKAYTRFPFGLLLKWWVLPVEETGFYVLPKNREFESDDFLIDRGRDSEQTPVDAKGEGTAVFSVREFRHGDHPKRIHWKASAKRAGDHLLPEASWYVKEMDTDQKNEVTVFWRGFIPSSDFSHDPEEMASFARSIYEMYAKSGVRFIWRTGGSEIKVEPGEEIGKPLLKYLSVFDPAHPDAPPASQFLTDTVVVQPRASERAVDLVSLYETWKKSNAR